MPPPLQRWLTRLSEKLVARFYEGPEPPPRLASSVDDFAALYPKATRGAWVAAMRELVETAYRAGYTRGFEHYFRDPSQRPDDPDELAAEDPGPPAPELPASHLDDIPSDGSELGLEDQAAYLELKRQYELDHLMGRGPRRS